MIIFNNQSNIKNFPSVLKIVYSHFSLLIHAGVTNELFSEVNIYMKIQVTQISLTCLKADTVHSLTYSVSQNNDISKDLKKSCISVSQSFSSV